MDYESFMAQLKFDARIENLHGIYAVFVRIIVWIPDFAMDGGAPEFLCVAEIEMSKTAMMTFGIGQLLRDCRGVLKNNLLQAVHPLALDRYFNRDFEHTGEWSKLDLFLNKQHLGDS